MKKLMLGNEAVARGAYEAGVKVATAYPGTPSTEITEFIAKYETMYAQWSPNEKVALEVAIGASVGGARSITSMKHVGLNVAADPLFTVSYTGVNGGLVIMVADDPGMHSSQNEQDSRYYARAAHIPMLEPADSQEAKDYIKEAFTLSEKYDTPILVRLTTRISHSQSLVEIQDPQEVELKPYEKDVMKYVMMPGMAIKRHVIVEERMKKMTMDASSMSINRADYKDLSMGFITSGIPYQYVKEVFPDASVLKLGMVHPLPKDLIQEFCSKVDKVYIIEELEPIIEEQIKSWGLDVEGKDLLTVQGEYSANMLVERIKKEDLQLKTPEVLPQRPPVLCAGCPHRSVYYRLKKLGKHATGDIGCYTLGALDPLKGLDTCVDMGASIGMLHGIEKARGSDFIKDWVSIIGDSTFVHSGITGLVDVVYNQGCSTVMILDNSTTGMTGHQENPATGVTLKGENTNQLDLVKLCESVGIRRVRTVNPFRYKELEEAISEETQIAEPSVIIVKAPCQLLDKSGSFVQNYIDEEKCKDCGMCLKLGCPAIKKHNGVMMIDDTLCVGCNLCVGVCKFQAIRKVGTRS
ncbi:indolepyruvate ferredoxin oxidoreductase subunit alpha [Alkalibacter rhizosphaerae]|uniref:Indolepyruvate oxidoreductase subunit IorA n=1 Tax=Alkalibacter rhizosphaerae TaxID=2815577 RepID=A0A975AIH4_9FIRM|nr:indolepyruvate ferredoxin oxidoreductase subunit alpha [Alkalibacter rhizosphaerae]QSX09083.1 indolepyruvate ferredoxin oxidoreductase subunit alpha [Alkalibacter rhizosphaerae]